jgi:L-ribulose-5-phosphate 3-epimerase
MLRITRRRFLSSAAAAGVCSRFAIAKAKMLRIGVPDWNLNRGASPEAVPLAARLRFEGVQISFGRTLVDDKMPTDSPAVIARYLSLSRQYHIPIDGTCVDKLHDNGLKSDPLARKWVLDSIRLTRDLQTKVLLLPFFGRWALQTREEMEFVGDALRELAPEAE